MAKHPVYTMKKEIDPMPMEDKETKVPPEQKRDYASLIDGQVINEKVYALGDSVPLTDNEALDIQKKGHSIGLKDTMAPITKKKSVPEDSPDPDEM